MWMSLPTDVCIMIVWDFCVVFVGANESLLWCLPTFWSVHHVISKSNSHINSHQVKFLIFNFQYAPIDTLNIKGSLQSSAHIFIQLGGHSYLAFVTNFQYWPSNQHFSILLALKIMSVNIDQSFLRNYDEKTGHIFQNCNNIMHWGDFF